MKPTLLAAVFTLLAVSATHAAPADTGTRTFPVIKVEITDADVSADLTDDVTDAMTTPANQIPRLKLLLQVANKTPKTLVITHGVSTFVVPRAANGFFPLAGDKLSDPIREKIALNIPRANSLYPRVGTHADKARYRLHQIVRLAARLDPDGTATVHYELFEQPIPLPHAASVPGAGGLTVEVTNTATFHSGETISLPIHAYGSGIQHRVYITVTVLPANG